MRSNKDEINTKQVLKPDPRRAGRGTRVLFAYKSHSAGESDPYTSLLPIGLGYMAALLKAEGQQARLANFSSFSWPEIEQTVKRECPQLVAISVFTHNRSESMRLARVVKKAAPTCLVVFGGPHATFCHEELMAGCDSVDAVIPGEGEAVMLELVRAMASGRGHVIKAGIPGVFTRGGRSGTANDPVDIEHLPPPAHAMDDAIGVDPRQQLEFIITSRGCPASCTFCASPRFWGRCLRFRSPRSVVEEIRHLRDRYGLLYFSIRDDTFTWDRDRAIEFCRLLVEERIFILWNCQSRVTAVDEELVAWMKRGGCECIQYGVESGSAKVLKILGKKASPDDVRRAARITREAGINLSVYLISGVPGEVEEDVEATLHLIDQILPHDGQVSPLAYYPGTPLFADAVNKGIVPASLFAKETGEAFLVRTDRFSKSSKARLLHQLVAVAPRSAYRKADFLRQKEHLGYCHATNLLMGQMFEENGKPMLAEREYREIATREPDNPWGWVALGELYARKGEIGKAKSTFEKVIELVPQHLPAYEALEELCRLDADRSGVARYSREIRRLKGMGEGI